MCCRVCGWEAKDVLPDCLRVAGHGGGAAHPRPGVVRASRAGLPAVSGFTAALALLGLVTLVLGAVYVAAWVLRVSRPPLLAKPFAGGLPSAEHAFSRYHVRWYAITMLFLAFDMEMIFMYPWTLVISAVGPSSVIEMFSFLGVLLAGVIYAWREGALRWA
jgi:NADH-quinone oxidoreductase subunit A